ncbi:hypothetical protein HGP05_11610 [Streptococcus sanguinis]|uniref:Uncharacterized protein n=1 Tax=Streptococcus sanguinis TaxID=1305 RepID=A0A7Y0VBM7_STRSA|nr:hypothetical protein [Streptococcus sanguinis]
MLEKGFTKTKRLKNSDKAGNYVVAYLTNLEIDDDQNTKKYVKGARHIYILKVSGFIGVLEELKNQLK